MPRIKDARKIKAIDIFKNTQNKIYKVLNTLECVEFNGTKTYIGDEVVLNNIIHFQDSLEPYKDLNRKGSVYSIYKIVNIVNADKIASTYAFTTAKKSSIIKDQGKIVDIFDKEISLSKNYINKIAEDRIETEDLSEYMIDKIRKEAKEKINNEQKNYEYLKKNYVNEELLFRSKPLKYVQLNWVYIDEDGKQKRTNKHISKELPNLLITNQELETDNFIASNKTDRFLKDARLMFGRIYAKSK